MIKINALSLFVHDVCLLLDFGGAQESLFLLFWLTMDRLYALYCRQLYTVRDGGTIALDWLLAFDLEGMGLAYCGIVYIIYGGV